MNMIRNNGVKKSANDVTKGIRKLFGSFPLLKRKIELMNNRINIMINNSNIDKQIIKTITNGFII